ncbi:MAG: Clp1/GlmU family protein [Armatimonadaceae bacterium]
MPENNETLPPIPAEWLPGVQAIRDLPDGATVLLIGASDRGKTTFAALAAQHLAAKMPHIAVVDTDIGQSEIGPPGTVGLAKAQPGVASLNTLKPSALFFVGAFAPNTVTLELVAATAQAVLAARKRQANRILVDTTGFVAGPSARRLKTAKAQAVQPHLILALERDGEVQGLCAAMAAVCDARVVSLPVPEEVGRKTPAMRSTRRLTRLARVLEETQEAVFPLDSVALLGTTLGAGTPLTPELRRWCAETLRGTVQHGEQADGILTLLAHAAPATADWEQRTGLIASHFKVRSVRVLDPEVLADVYLGCIGDGGRLLGVGRFLRWETEGRAVVAAVSRSLRVERVAAVAFGRVRLSANGSAIREIRPGEL